MPEKELHLLLKIDPDTRAADAAMRRLGQEAAQAGRALGKGLDSGLAGAGVPAAAGRALAGLEVPVPGRAPAVRAGPGVAAPAEAQVAALG
jgi:hypothetical protein